MRSLVLSLALAATAAAAHAQTNLLASLSRCDASFFLQLSAQREALRPQGDIQARAGAATFIVPSLTQPGQNRLSFAQPLRQDGLTLVAYLDELTPIPGGVDVSWGFLIEGQLAEVAARLKGLIWEGQRLRHETRGGYFVRSEVWRHADPRAGWAREATENGPPKPGTVERVFMIEADEDMPGRVRAGCSLQGDVTREMLVELRPDFPVDAK